jgi:predicted glutamine amidotransferase
MCRLLGAMSATPSYPLATLLGEELEPFAALSSHHCDGWGIAYWNEHDDLVTAKAPEVARDSPAFHAAIDAARTDAAVLHLRKASENMPNTAANTHPFVAGSVSLAHNGYLSPRSAVDALLEDVAGRPCEGDTDSERFFGLVLAEMRHSGPVDALARAAERITAVADVHSLNSLLLTHEAMYAFTWYDEDVLRREKQDIDSYILRFRPSREDVIVASSGWEQASPRWEVLANGTILAVSRGDLRTTVHKTM